ncbi:Phosphotransferase enzyme family protein [Microbulbifer thermotolerans]|uniref:phosphotransferase family protein n=1 Tax=Microbulbifer thermotolerans TaxID=252514 RepID=UPI0008E57308|nr:aminoglycoside phosphotransferase family protein [Microbulbifer thermotolerans]SFC75274.1 Phosphotransferase enzyme family protein [Microbulbifer thermotolerans]
MDREELASNLLEKGLLQSKEVTFTALSGGVSCEILLVDDGSARFVVKRALKKLKVKDDWFADVRRNITEQEYLRYVGGILPAAVPQIIYADNERYFFCMEMIEGGMTTWKSRLLERDYNSSYAQLAGKYLGVVHRSSIDEQAVHEKFDTAKDFYELRIDPYLLKTGDRHPRLKKYFIEEADRISDTARCLIHGDYSPKNLMVGEGRLVILDCEVACFGDPVFDLAFLLNHLFLKSIHQKKDAQKLFVLVGDVWKSYQKAAGAVVDQGFEARLCHLIPMLMLARIDGKSPAEYLSDESQQSVREFSYTAIPFPQKKLDEFCHQWADFMSVEKA